MAAKDNSAQGPKPSSGGTGPSKNDERLSQHKQMAMGNPPKGEKPSTTRK